MVNKLIQSLDYNYWIKVYTQIFTQRFKANDDKVGLQNFGYQFNLQSSVFSLPAKKISRGGVHNENEEKGRRTFCAVVIKVIKNYFLCNECKEYTGYSKKFKGKG